MCVCVCVCVCIMLNGKNTPLQIFTRELIVNNLCRSGRSGINIKDICFRKLRFYDNTCLSEHSNDSICTSMYVGILAGGAKERTLGRKQLLMCLCVCVCVCERERERERERENMCEEEFLIIGLC